MTHTNSPRNDVTKMWNVKLLGQHVRRLDELKWQMQTSRQNLMERIVRIGLAMLESNNPEDIERFNRLERQYCPAPAVEPSTNRGWNT